jgi:3-hydroxyisobutyrate dehydrogenase-like beta-hydroxyacid dehydrogenase
MPLVPAGSAGTTPRAFSGLFTRVRASSLQASALVAVELEPVMVRRSPARELVADSPVLAEQRAQLRPKGVAVSAPDHAGIDRKRGRGVGVADLALDVGDVEAGGEHERDVGPPQRVGGDVGDDCRLLALGPEEVGAPERPNAECGWWESPREVAAAADVVFSLVTDDAAVQAITSGPDGILAALQPGKVYIDLSTISPRTSRQVAEQARSVGAEMLDAPVSGSIPQAETGTLAIMVGGEEHAFRVAQPVLRELGQTVTHVGTNGQGLLLKLAISVSLAVQTVAFSEGLVLAERGGIEARLAAEVMSTSSIGSPMLKARVPLLLDLPERAWFDVTMMHKDIRLALETADQLATPLPSAGIADQILTTADELGYAQRDLASLHDVLAELAAA